MDILNVIANNGVLRRIISMFIGKKIGHNSDVKIDTLAIKSNAGTTTLRLSGEITVQDEDVIDILVGLGIL